MMAAILSISSSCGDDGGERAAEPDPTHRTANTSATTATGASAMVVDWHARTVTPSAVGPWAISFCEGEAPLVCLDRDGRRAGALERSEYPVQSIPPLQQALDAGISARAALAVLAQQTVETFAADRREGCGSEYLVVADPVVAQPVLGGEGVRYGWTAKTGDEVVERSVTYAAARDGVLHLLVAGGLSDGGCIEKLGEFDVEGLEAALPVLDLIAASSR